MPFDWVYNHAGIGRTFPTSDVYGQHAALIETVLPSGHSTVTIVGWAVASVWASIDGGAKTNIGTLVADVTPQTFDLYNDAEGSTHDVTVWVDSVNALSTTKLFSTSVNTAPTLPARYSADQHHFDNTYIQSDGVPFASRDFNFGGGHNAYPSPMGQNAVGGFRFRGAISGVRFFVALGAAGTARVHLWRRAVSGGAWSEVGTSTGASDFGFYPLSLIGSLDSAQEWEYRAVYTGDGATGYLIGLSTNGGTGVNTTALTSAGYELFFGDSITANYGLTSVADGWVYQVARDTGYTFYNAGVAGEAVISPGAGFGAGEDRAATLFPGLAEDPVAIVILEGRNDNLNEASADTTNYQAAYETILGYAVASQPKVLALGLLPNGDYATHARTDAATLAAVTAQAPQGRFVSTTDPTPIINRDVDPTPGAHLQNDGLITHPNATGNIAISGFVTPVLAALISPPSAVRRKHKRLIFVRASRRRRRIRF